MYIPIAMVTIVPTNPRTRPIIAPLVSLHSESAVRASNQRPRARGYILETTADGRVCGVSGRLGNGDPGGSRTPNPQIRSLMLYPVELRGHPPLGAVGSKLAMPRQPRL